MQLDTDSVAFISEVQGIPVTKETNEDGFLESVCRKLFSSLPVNLVWGGLINVEQRLAISGVFEKAGVELVREIELERSFALSIRECVASLTPVRVSNRTSNLHQHLFVSGAAWLHALDMDIHPLVLNGDCIGVFGIAASADLIGKYQDVLEFSSRHIGFVIGVLRAFTLKEKTESELRLAAAVFDNSLEGIFITNVHGTIINSNEAATSITGYSKTELLACNPSLLKSDRHGPDFYRALWQGVRIHGQWQGEIWNKRKNGEIYPQWLSISAIRNNYGIVENYVGIFIDISKQKAAENKLNFLAYYDKLSNLPNRELFHDRLKTAIARAKRNRSEIAVLFIDVDHFKYINDTFGHDKGDLLLQKVAKTLKKCLRENDTLARMGGDEFTVILEDFDRHEDVEVTASRILEAFKKPLFLNNQKIYISVSIGVSFYPEDAVDKTMLMKHADTAMYSAKNNGRKCLNYFHATMETYSVMRVEMEKQLHRALDNDEFELYYQPQIDIRSGRLIGAEALIRWRHPQKGLILPHEFISIAEDTGLIIPIGKWVLSQAWRDCRRWHKAKQAIRVSVNLSALQFTQSCLAELLAEVLDYPAIEARFLEIELTETLVMRDVEDTLEYLKMLKNAGVQLSVDDFGTGYSSLSYLKKFPIDRIKIDRSFISDITKNSNDAAIVIAIIAMAHCMGLSVIAEGVETLDQLNFLKLHGCDEIQGFLVAEPLPGDVFPKQFQQYSKPLQSNGILIV